MSSLVIENKKSILPALSVMPQKRMKINVVRCEINPVLIDGQISLVSRSSNLPRKSPSPTVMFNLSVKTVGSQSGSHFKKNSVIQRISIHFDEVTKVT